MNPDTIIRCPTCGREADVLVHNIQDGSQFFLRCAPGSFGPRRTLTLEDLAFMKACGVDPELSPALADLVKLSRRKDSGEL